MGDSYSWLLVAGAALSASAALLHLGCIAFGAPWYRAFGAGERMAKLAAAGHPMPTIVTLGLASVLMAWAAYALSGAGVLPRFPALRAVLCVITAAYLLRGIAFPLMRKKMPGRSPAFWLWSSAICMGIGAVHLAGLFQAWDRI